MSVTVWEPSAGEALADRLDELDVLLERARGLLRTRATPVAAGAFGIPATVLQSVAIADETELACTRAQIDAAALRTAVQLASWSYDTTERITRVAVETVGAAVGASVGSMLLGGLLAGFASLPMAAPIALLGLGLAHTPLPAMLLDLAAQALAPLAPLMPELLNDPAFVDALALAVESADEALAGLTGQGADPLMPLWSQLQPDDEGLAAGAGVALALALLVTGQAPSLPGAQPVVAVRQPAPPPAQPPVSSYSTAFAHLTTADGEAIEVQRYEQADGTVVWQVFARGTESFAMDDPSTAYDLTANIENAANASGSPLVGSAAAVEQALHDAGVADGDVVQLFGYSQGGAAVAAAAAYGDVQVDTVVTFGAPVGATPVPAGTTAVAIQNDSDLVPSLGGTHGDGRMVIEASPDLDAITTDRYTASGQPLSTVAAGGHHPEAYAATAAMLDGSDDDLALAVWEEVQAATGDADATGGFAYAVER